MVETARERVEAVVRKAERTWQGVFGHETVSVTLDDLRELLRIPTCNSEIIDELLSLKPFLEAHHCKTTVIDKAVELLRITEPSAGDVKLAARLRQIARYTEVTLGDSSRRAILDAASRLEARPTVVEGDALGPFDTEDAVRSIILNHTDADTNDANYAAKLIVKHFASLAVSPQSVGDLASPTVAGPASPGASKAVSAIRGPSTIARKGAR